MNLITEVLSEQDQDLMQAPNTMHEIQEAIHQLNHNSSGSIDGLSIKWHYILFRYLYVSPGRCVQSLWTKNKIPEKITSDIAVLIPKYDV